MASAVLVCGIAASLRSSRIAVASLRWPSVAMASLARIASLLTRRLPSQRGSCCRVDGRVSSVAVAGVRCYPTKQELEVESQQSLEAIASRVSSCVTRPSCSSGLVGVRASLGMLHIAKSSCRFRTERDLSPFLNHSNGRKILSRNWRISDWRRCGGSPESCHTPRTSK